MLGVGHDDAAGALEGVCDGDPVPAGRLHAHVRAAGRGEPVPAREQVGPLRGEAPLLVGSGERSVPRPCDRAHDHAPVHVDAAADRVHDPHGGADGPRGGISAPPALSGGFPHQNHLPSAAVRTMRERGRRLPPPLSALPRRAARDPKRSGSKAPLFCSRGGGGTDKCPGSRHGHRSLLRAP